jgi:hypothetical protein
MSTTTLTLLLLTRADLLLLQDAVDDSVSEFDSGRAPSSLVALQRKLHDLIQIRREKGGA